MNKNNNNLLGNDVNQSDDELSLSDVLSFFKLHYKAILASSLAGALLALVLTLLLPAEWEAAGLVRIGQLGSAGSLGNPIEPSLQVVERLKNKSFQFDVLKQLGLLTDEEDSKFRRFRDNFKVKLEKSDLINLSIRAPSQSDARRYMNAIVNELKFIHVKKSAPTIDRWHQELASIKVELALADSEAKRLTKSLEGQSSFVNDRSFSQAALLSNILIAREGELRSLRDRKRLIEEQLSPERTFYTGVVGRVEISKNPVFPKKSIFIPAGLILGLFFGLIFSFFTSLNFKK